MKITDDIIICLPHVHALYQRLSILIWINHSQQVHIPGINEKFVRLHCLCLS